MGVHRKNWAASRVALDLFGACGLFVVSLAGLLPLAELIYRRVGAC